MSNKKQRIDSTAGMVSMLENIGVTIEPPAHCHLRPRDMPFWVSIVNTRDVRAWTAPDLEHAANLARAKADIERLQEELDREGDIIINARGTPIVNPKHQLLETLSRRSAALSRMLHVHAEATGGKAGKEAKGNKAKSDAVADQAARDEEDDDGLLARPGASH